ncbi:MAG: regulator of sigma protease [Hyphomicrobiales bacterium]|jgi:regulator of sigma E protease|nr:regulator of sigma protease [Hyphomicrobiales bacterium]
MNIVSNIGSWGGWLTGYVVPFLFVLTIVVFFHELGHFLVARWCGVRVLVFSIGFGPELFGFNDRHATRWKVSAIPLGGYVKFFGDENAASVPDQDKLQHMSDAERRESFFHKPVPQRAAIVAAGPIANFILAIVIFATLALVLGKNVALPRVDEVKPGTAAAAAGFKTGDMIVSVDGKAIEGFSDVARIVALSPNRPLAFEIDRGGERVIVNATPAQREERDPRFGNVQRIGALDISGPIMPARVVTIQPRSPAAEAGFEPGDRVRTIDGKPVGSFLDLRDIVAANPDKALEFEVDRGGRLIRLRATPSGHNEKERSGAIKRVGQLGIQGGYEPADTRAIKYGPVSAVTNGVAETWFVVERTLAYIGGVIVGRESADQLGGPIRIAQVSGQVATAGFVALIHLAAVLSISIGLLNLFPIPLLDGGHLLFYAIEAVRGRPLSERAQEYGFRIGLAIVLLLMIFATFNDILHLASL